MSPQDVLAVVREHWDDDAGDAEPVPPRGGTEHWVVRVKGRPALFATLARQPAEAALAGAAALAFRLDFVVAGLPTHELDYTVAVRGGSLSCTPWVWGATPTDDRATAEATATALGRLHAVTPPSGLPRWEPAPGTPDELAAAARDAPFVVTHGDPGPHHQLVTPVRTLLTGWRGLCLAPAERDLRVLPPDLRPDADPALVALFDAEADADVGG